MTEMTYIPNPRDVITKMKAIDLEAYVAGSIVEREYMLDCAKWLLVFLCTLDIQRVPKQHRAAFDQAERSAGQAIAELMLRAENATDQSTRSQIADLYSELKDDVLFACGVFDQNLASLFKETTECQT